MDRRAFVGFLTAIAGIVVLRRSKLLPKPAKPPPIPPGAGSGLAVPFGGIGIDPAYTDCDPHDPRCDMRLQAIPGNRLVMIGTYQGYPWYGFERLS